jgi:hypothetical protein
MPRGVDSRRTKMTKLDEGIDRISELDRFAGTYVIYGAAADTKPTYPYVCDVEIEMMIESNRKQLRSHRLRCKTSGEAPPRIHNDELRHELIVIFGPEMSPKNAATTLRHLARRIEKNGLLIGRDEDGDDLLFEKVDGSIVDATGAKRG